MNEKLNLAEILKDCPKGTKLYSTVYGEVELEKVTDSVAYPIIVKINDGRLGEEILVIFTSGGIMGVSCKGECTLFPSRDQRDWSKFSVKQPKFDPKTLKPFDKVLVRDKDSEKWSCGIFSHKVIDDDVWGYNVGEFIYSMCIPYNDDTKHLVGTSEEAPEFYRYWEY